MKITFLGTSSGTPTRDRNVTAQAVQFDDGRLWLLDCGEATQHQLMRAGLRPGKIERVLITHLHGDHCYGLPGLLACIGIHGREQPLELIGPRGLRELVEVVLRVSSSQPGYPLRISEIDGPASFDHASGWSVSAQPLRHRVTCFGYSLREPPRPGRFHPDRAQALGIPAGPLYRRLQNNETITLADGRVIAPDAVCDAPRRGRHLVLLGDTCGSDAIADDGTGCDLLVHEATYDAGRDDKARQWGHSTSVMAGDFAQKLRASTLILTHFSSRYTDGDGDEPMTVADLVREAAAACPQTTVLAADDLFVFELK